MVYTWSVTNATVRETRAARQDQKLVSCWLYGWRCTLSCHHFATCPPIYSLLTWNATSCMFCFVFATSCFNKPESNECFIVDFLFHFLQSSAFEQRCQSHWAAGSSWMTSAHLWLWLIRLQLKGSDASNEEMVHYLLCEDYLRSTSWLLPVVCFCHKTSHVPKAIHS